MVRFVAGHRAHKSLVNQGEVKIRQIANAAMYELRRFTTGSAGKVHFLNERDFISACDSIKCYSGSGDATSNYEDIKMVSR